MKDSIAKILTYKLNHLLIALFFSLPSLSYAIDKIKPDLYITLQTEYDDNIFFEKTTQPEFITQIVPGINTKIIAARWFQEIDYNVRFLNYRNIKQKKLTHNLNIKGWHKLSNKSIFSIQGDRIEDKEETIEEDFEVTKREYLKQKIGTTIKFQLKHRLETDIGYQYEDFDIRNENQRDSQEKQLFFDTSYTLSERLKTTGRYQYKKREFKTYQNLSLDLLALGITYELSPRLKSKLMIKHKKKAKDDKNDSAFAFAVNLNGEMNKKTTLSLTIQKATEFTRSWINYVEIKKAKIEMSRELNKKTNFFSSLDFSQGTWQNTTRRDKLRLLNAGLFHQVSKDISFNINYNYIERKSNVLDEGIKNNIYTFKFQIR